MAHILLPTDMSEQSLKAATLAVDLFGADGNEFTLIHAFSGIGLTDPAMQEVMPDLQEANDKALEAFEGRLRLKCDLSNARVQRIVSFGPLATVVNEAARESDIDLVVMAPIGERASAALGGHTIGLILNADLPVLEVPPEVTSLAFHKILFADDRSPITEHALDILAAIARRAQAEVIIAHVATGRPSNDQVDNAALFERVFRGVRLRTIMVENNDVEEALLDVAGRERVDLIALLHRHRGIWKGLFHTSTTKAVALSTTIPVLALEQ